MFQRLYWFVLKIVATLATAEVSAWALVKADQKRKSKTINMGICLETFRIHIGTYLLRHSKISKVKCYQPSSNMLYPKCKTRKMTLREVFVSCLIWLMLLNCSTEWNLSADQNEIKRVIYSVEPGCKDIYFSQWATGLSWSYSRTLYYTYGNRRNLGYHYFSWNCDRGLLSKHKIEDIQVFAAKHSPHLSEVDLVKMNKT